MNDEKQKHGSGAGQHDGGGGGGPDFSRFAATQAPVISERRKSPRLHLPAAKLQVVSQPIKGDGGEKQESQELSLFTAKSDDASSCPRSNSKRRQQQQKTLHSGSGKRQKQSPDRTSKRTISSTPRTCSFRPLTSTSSPVKVPKIDDIVVATNDDVLCPPPPHTLILGTHPSVESLRQAQYYAHPMNAFWWIAGDCLGFRRNSGISDTTGQPFSFSQHVRHQNVLPYVDQLQTLLNHGFFLWDVIASCQRPGSLDQNITSDVPNDIPALCEAHPTLKRIVLANGGTGCSLFLKHFREWMKESTLSGSIYFEAGGDRFSGKHFGKICNELAGKRPAVTDRAAARHRTITLLSAMSVSPAAASFTYLEKRDYWETHVYNPGLRDLGQRQDGPKQRRPKGGAAAKDNSDDDNHDNGETRMMTIQSTDGMKAAPEYIPARDGDDDVKGR